ncbi:MAG: 4-alpha-glucanotransferase [Erysipelotrichaceae bacterium]|nr:4-alpha-glucanotransferase [Erysipelotrichaceae bacterium]MDY5251551.1 4-alpha-glucanotransferase [Erysipelotrichaceae bacterium]
MKKAGVLMPIASLPSLHGIGDFGKTSYEFVDLIARTGFKIWQILPLNPLGYGNSPYQPYSSYAMDELYISLELLKKAKLIKTIRAIDGKVDRIYYDKVRLYKKPYLEEAFSNFKADAAYAAFLQSNPWVESYARFITLKKLNDNKCWNCWEKQTLTPEDEPHLAYERFIQYMLYQQWQQLKKYANKKGIMIMGDIPFYVGLDSNDVYDNKACFLLDKDNYPSFIAGVPPDYFSATGQRWGNPIYDWEYLQQTDFKFWIERLSHTAKMFDIIRIDHFRAFDTYWKIKADCPTAIDGQWCEAPGYAFFDRLFEVCPDINIVVEDLGLLRDEVLILRDHYQFKGMHVIQFNFDPKNQTELPENLIIYTGTHDNQTLRSWYAHSKASFKKHTQAFFKAHNYRYELMNDNFIAYALNSPCEYAIINFFDLLNKTDRYRINTPGTIGDPDWNPRIQSYDAYKEVISKYRRMIKKSER